MLLTALTPVPPDMFTPEDREAARNAGAVLSRLGPGDVQIEAGTGHNERQSFTLPAAAADLLARLLVELAAGRTVTMMPSDAMLTTQQAADMLNVSRPYVVGLVDAGTIPHTKVGTHRRIALQDLLAYKRESDARSEEAMDRLAALDQELGLDH